MPTKELLALTSNDSIVFYSDANRQTTLKEGTTFALDQEHMRKLQTIKLTSDGSKLVLVFRSHCDMYKFDSETGIDFSSCFSISITWEQFENQEYHILNFIFSIGDKVAACHDKKTIYTCSLDAEKE